MYEKITDDFDLRLENKKGQVHIHINVYNYNKEIYKTLLKVFDSIVYILNKNNVDKLYFMQDVKDNKLLKFSSMFGCWNYETTLTLTNGKEYNLLSYSIK